MEKSTKVIIGIVGGLLLAAGIGAAIYFATKKKTAEIADKDKDKPKDDKPKGTGLTNLLNNLMNAVTLIKSFTVESFPLKPGMKGPNVKELQDSLRTKWNQLAVGSDGIFGVKTAKALREIGYGKSLLSGVTREDIDNIFDKKPAV